MKSVILCFILFMIVMVSGCAVIDKIQEQSSEQVSELIVKYCNATEERFREDFRKKINDKMIGLATVKVECVSYKAPATGVD